MKGCLKIAGYIFLGIIALGVLGVIFGGGNRSSTTRQTGQAVTLATFTPTQEGLVESVASVETPTPGPPTDTPTITQTPLPTDTPPPTSTAIPANSYTVSGEAGWPELTFALKQVDLWPALPDGKLPQQGLFVVLLGDLTAHGRAVCLFKRNYELSIGNQTFKTPETNAVDSLREIYLDRDDPVSMFGVCPGGDETRRIFLWFDVSNTDGPMQLRLDGAGEIKIADSFGRAIAAAGLDGFPTSAPTATGTDTNTPTATVPTDTPAPTDTPLPTVPTDTPIPPTPLPAVGQDVTVDQVRWKVLAAENLGNTLKSDNQFVKDLTTSGMYIRVRFEVENLSPDMLTYAGINLIDDQGRKYTSSSDAIMFLPDGETCVLENLNPNITKTCTHIFEVPTNATGLNAVLGDLKMFGGQEAMVDLGLSQ